VKPYSRRKFLSKALGTSAAVGLSSHWLPGCMFQVQQEAPQHYTLIAKPSPITIIPNTMTQGLTFNGQYPAPILRGKQGQPLYVRFINQLNQPTTIHWHGLRLDNAMDGVPHLTQHPVQPGETFEYKLDCPDAGTFWYHPHMNSLEQLGKGLTGLLIVDEKHPTAYQHELCVELRDWRLAEDGSFLPLSLPRQAARMGTLGTVQTIGGQTQPSYTLPAGALARVRIANIDNTRLYTLSSGSQQAWVIAIDGMPVTTPYLLESHPLGAGARVDLALVMPNTPGQSFSIFDQKGLLDFKLFEIKASQPSLTPFSGDIPALPPNPIPKPDLKNAKKLSFSFEWTGAFSPTTPEGKVDQTFWAINRKPWTAMVNGQLPEPLATLKLGQTYLMDWYNATPHAHPIHLHGFAFTVLSSNKRKITPYLADTLVLSKHERAQVAFVADNPGRWMFHCHVIEHMKTGLMGYLTVR